jgi:SnoaL-like protein
MVSDVEREDYTIARMSGHQVDLNQREISDRLIIAELLDAYASALDRRDWRGVRDVFTNDAVLDYSSFGGPRGSCDDAIAWIEASLSAVPITQHLLTNKLISLDGDAATAQCAVLNPMGFDGGRIIFVGGSYRDRLARTRDGWRIIERVAEFSWSSRPIKT